MQRTARHLWIPIVAATACGAIPPPSPAAPADPAAPKGAPTTRPAAPAPKTIVDALGPLVPRLPAKDAEINPVAYSERREIQTCYMSLSPMFVVVPKPERHRIASAATRHVAGFAGTDGKAQGEAIGLTVFTLTDPAVARDLPLWLAEAFRDSVPIFRRGGVSVDKLDLSTPADVKADACQLVRAVGQDTDAKKPWTSVQLRATRGNRMVELALRNAPMPEKDMAALVNDVLDQVTTLPANTPPIDE